MAWEIIELGTNVIQNGGNITLTEPDGTAAGDLIVACIAHKSNVAFTKPSTEWNEVGYLSNGDIDASGGKASGGMWYCIRGASAPSYVWTRTAGDISMGRTVTYRGNSATPHDTGSANQRGAVSEPVGITITTAEANELLVAMVAHGDSSTTTVFDAATAPSVASNGTIPVTTEPTLDTWHERTDTGTATGSDTGLFIADAIKETGGATGAFSALASTNSDSVTIIGAFKLAGATGFNAKVMVDGAWKVVPSAMVMVNGAWKAVTSMKVMVNGAWKGV